MNCPLPLSRYDTITLAHGGGGTLTASLIHDIFLPHEYPREWVIADNRSWNEQYVVRALLMYSSAFSPAKGTVPFCSSTAAGGVGGAGGAVGAGGFTFPVTCAKTRAAGFGVGVGSRAPTLTPSDTRSNLPGNFLSSSTSV